MDGIAPTFILTKSRSGLLPVIFHKFVTELRLLIDGFVQHEKCYREAIVRFSEDSSLH